MRPFLAYLLAAALLAAGPVSAQDDDGGGFLERQLESLLSGEGRDVSITGFRGALSSNASLDTMTFSDADGVWLRLQNVDLVWTRSALLRGRVEVNRLTAEEIEFARPPLPANEMPSAEAPGGFSLPELPVSVNVGELSADRLILGEPVLGTAATLTLEGALSLADGEGSGRFAAERIDGPEGTFVLEGNFANATGVLTVSATIDEAPGGLVATLAGLPGEPALGLDLSGTGPLSDFGADLSLSTDGQERVAGRLEILAAGPDAADTAFRADLSGDVAPLFFPEYQAFFGPDLSLVVAGTARGDGSVGLEELALRAAQLRLAGRAEIGADGLPELIDLEGGIAAENGGPVLLPVAGAETRIDRADLRVSFDASVSENWSAQVEIAGLSRPGLAARSIALDGTGRIEGRGTPRVTADLDFAATALDLGDAEAQAALGEDVTGRLAVDWTGGEPVEITALRVDGESYGLDGRATIDTADGLDIETEVQVAARDLSVFSGIANRPLAGAITADIAAEAAPLAGLYDIGLEARGEGLGTGIAEVDQLLAGRAQLALEARRDETGTHVDRFTADTDAARIAATASLTSARGEAEVEATLTRTDVIAEGVPGPLDLRLTAEGPTDLWDILLTVDGPGTAVDAEATLDLTGDVPALVGDATADIDDIAPYSARAGRELAGAVSAFVSGSLSADLSRFDVEARAETTGLEIGQPQADRVLAGQATVALTARREGGTLSLPSFRFESPQLAATASGTAETGAALTEIRTGSGTASVTLRESEGILPGMPVPLTARLRADGTAEAVALDLAVEGDALNATAQTQVALGGDAPAASGTVALRAGDIAPFSALAGRDLAGSVEADAEGSVSFDLETFDVTATARTRGLSVGQPDIDALLAGEGRATVEARREGGVIDVDRLEVETRALSLTANGTTGLQNNAARFDLRLADVSRYVPGFSGRATASGTATQAGSGPWQVDVTATAPGGTRATVTGSAAADFGRLDLRAQGSLPLQAANTFIAPRAVAGTARFDLRVDGPPALGSVSGRVETADARFTAPELGVVLNRLGATVDIAGGRARVDAGANIRGGGRVTAAGPIGLAPPFPAELAIRLQNAALSSPDLYRTTVTGGVSIDGGLAGGARIGGALSLGETEIRIPSGASAVSGPSFDIRHVNDTPAVRETRARAGLLESQGAAGAEEGGGGPVYPLALTISAPNRIFVRGRGLEAELGGELRVGGTTANVVPTGQFELIRGRLDILGQRLSFDEGVATLQGDFNPYLRLVAETQQDDTLIRIVVQGLAASPEILFQSEPDLPEDEVLARLLFGRSVQNLSPFQAAQLASAVAQLAGRGGEGLVSRLRQNFGLDDLDVTPDGSGGVDVRAGKYISENIYSDVSVDSTGESEVSINLDLSRSLTVRGTVGSTGNTGVGVFFERDY